MKSRYWITLLLRVSALALIGITIRPVAGEVWWSARRLYESANFFWETFYPENWISDALLFALGLYLLLGGNWVVNRILRGFDAGRCALTSRCWISVLLRLIGLVLIVMTAKLIAAETARVGTFLARAEMEYFWNNFSLFDWAELLVGSGLALYLFLGGQWLIDRIFRGLEEGRCAKCGYDMTGLDDGAECPECGTERTEEP